MSVQEVLYAHANGVEKITREFTNEDWQTYVLSLETFGRRALKI